MSFQRKLQLATDFYQLSMGNVYYLDNKKDQIAVFDLFIRKNPCDGGYTIAAGLEQIIEYIEQLHFDDEDIALLKKNHPEFDENYLKYLRNFSFSGEIYAVPEGTIVFPNEPIIRVKAPLIQAQLIETTMLTIINHQSLIATKASRIVDAADGGTVLEFGLRRAHGSEAGLYGARAAIIGGCAGTSNVESEYLIEIPSKGTMSHSLVQSYDSELEAFRNYAKYNPNNLILLVDTYDTLNSGVPNAIKIFQELREKNQLGDTYGIRLDSGDLAYLSKTARKMLDQAGFADAIISASSDLDEYIIRDLKLQGATIDSWGVGTKMITSYDCPALGAVYKLSQIEEKGQVKPKIKISNDVIKITNPGYKKVVRFYDRNSHMALADLILLDDEKIDEKEPLEIFDPICTWKRKVLTNFYAKELLIPIFVNGKKVYQSPNIKEIQNYVKHQKQFIGEEYRRALNPHIYHVDLSEKLWNLKQQLIHQER
ncbi:nicotinate phosphoribosyltransferase [Garciella nitratireducens]|uniref:Nicotinate phosphoribosyltransferase n=1 Tax=Garciella nitratireducens DSM 15102 TaxID=1121911 RepID=A0A1T4LTI2_9FIRM|nr:nicotinate phosphoribosyltransferase [Garciella nitratireducens]SJZ57985.1 nicotinate phosphoribosyltransferase [Garciella nitratireducens DSM 15102]